LIERAAFHNLIDQLRGKARDRCGHAHGAVRNGNLRRSGAFDFGDPTARDVTMLDPSALDSAHGPLPDAQVKAEYTVRARLGAIARSDRRGFRALGTWQ
jgi:hypothetical protein